MSRLKKSPKLEGVNVDAELDLFYDRRKFEAANADDELTLFPPNPQNTDLYSNYNQNPFEGTAEYRIIAARVRPTFTVLRQDDGNNIDPLAIANQLKHAVLTIKDRGGQNRVIQRRLPSHYDANNLEVMNFTANRNDGDTATTSYLFYGGYAIRSLPEWFTLSATQQFDFNVKFPDSTVFPTQSEIEASGQGINHPFGLEAVFQYASLN
jgi:hypothetical protein